MGATALATRPRQQKKTVLPPDLPPESARPFSSQLALARPERVFRPPLHFSGSCACRRSVTDGDEMSDVDDDVAQLRMGMERLQNKLLNPKPKASARSKATKSETPKSRPAGKTSSTAGKAIRSTKAKTISASGRKLPLGGGAALPASVGRRKKATKKADPFNDASKSQNSFASRVQTAEKHRGLVSQLETVTRDLKLLSSGMDHSEAIEDSRECGDEVISASPSCMDYGSLLVSPNVPKSVYSDEQAGSGIPMHSTHPDKRVSGNA